MTSRPLGSLLIAAIVVCVPSATTYAQGRTWHFAVEGESHRGTLLDASLRGIALETDEGKLQLRFHSESRVIVRGTGDAGFLTEGAIIEVSGQFNGKVLEDADISVHVNPQATARPGVVKLYSDSPKLSIKGRVVSLDPLAIKTIDMVRLEVKSQNIGVPTPPTAAGKLIRVTLKDPAPQEVKLVLGNNLRLAEKGDPLRVFVADKRPGFVRNATITKTEPLKSKAAARKEKEADTKADGNSD